MKILIAYYSKTGHTKKVAEDLAKYLNADIDEIKDLKNRQGIINWLFSGRDEVKQNLTEIQFEKNPAKYDMVIVGSPVWAWGSTPAARSYLLKNRALFKKLALFITSGGTSIEKPREILEKVVGFKAAAAEGWTEPELRNENVYKSKLQKLTEAIRAGK